MSRDYDIPVKLISSFNRSNYNQVVCFKSFQESGAIEYASCVVLGLQLKGVKDLALKFEADKRKETNKLKNETTRKLETSYSVKSELPNL